MIRLTGVVATVGLGLMIGGATADDSPGRVIFRMSSDDGVPISQNVSTDELQPAGQIELQSVPTTGAAETAKTASTSAPAAEPMIIVEEPATVVTTPVKRPCLRRFLAGGKYANVSHGDACGVRPAFIREPYRYEPKIRDPRFLWRDDRNALLPGNGWDTGIPEALPILPPMENDYFLVPRNR